MSARRLRVLYVTDRFDGPYRYRVQHACEQLRRDGAVANVGRVDDPRVPKAVQRYGVVVLFRLLWSDQVEEIVRAARAASVPLVFDIDDLTFDPDFARFMPFRRRYSAEQWASTYGRQMASLRRTFDASDLFIGSTAELAEHARRLGKVAHVYPNLVPPFYLRMGKLLSPLRRDPTRRPTVGYFSGSDTHDEDFASVANALTEVIREHPDTRLLVVGHLDLGQRHPLLAARVARLPYMHWRDFAVAYLACDVTIAPQAQRNSFTSSKSALKFFESGAFMTPVVATPVREMVDAIRDGENGFLAESERDWVRALRASLDRATSERIGRAARRTVEERYSPAAHRKALYSLLERVAVSPSGSDPRPTPLETGDETGRNVTLTRALRPIGAARDLVSMVRTLRESLPESTAPAGDSSIAEQVFRDPHAAESAARQGGMVLDAASLGAWFPNDQVGRCGALPGERRSTGSDPHLTSAWLEGLDPSRLTHFAVRLRAASEAPRVRCQLYFKCEKDSRFREERSIAFDVPADGLDRTFVFDLRSRPGLFAGGARITHLRFDPMDTVGSFRLDGMALLPDPSRLGAAAEAGEEPTPDLSLSVASSEAPAAIRRCVSGLADGERLTVRVDRAPRAARWALEDWLIGAQVTVLEIRADGEDAVMVTLARDQALTLPGVDIVVPIFNAKALVARCLSSVVRHATGDVRLVAIDDASTDPEVKAWLDAFQENHPRVIVLRNENNLGFVGTANRGMRHAAGRDVLLLNSDTEVFAGFLERIARVAYSDPRAGLVSPLSNNATICSVPDFCRNNPLPEGATAADVAEVVRRASPRERPELVTPHGFCMYLRADVMKEVGLFDETLFGKGFGEENDLGERAKGVGYKTLLADDVYVWHEGKGSFGEEGVILEGVHGKVLAKRHPGYHAAVADFVRDNPLFGVQEAVRRHLRRRSDRLEPAPLVVLHASPFGAAPGGVEHCVRDLVGALSMPRTVLVYPAEGDLEVTEVLGGDIEQRSSFRYRLGYPPERFSHEHQEAACAFEEVLELFHIGWVHFHHLMFLPLGLGAVVRERKLPYLFTVHDFYAGCPSFNLLDFRDMSPCCPASCTDPVRTEACQRALFTTLGNPLPASLTAFVREHRQRFQALLEGAEVVTFPSPSSRSILSSILELGNVRTDVIPHGHALPARPPRAPNETDRIRVALVGQVAYASKGAESYLALMRATASLPIEWHIFGQTDLFGFDERLSVAAGPGRVVRHGPYDRDTIVGRICESGSDVGFLFPAWPETFSYTLSEMLAAGMPVIARRIGALEDRLSGTGYATLVDDVEGAAKLLSELCGDRARLRQMAAEVPELAGLDEPAARYGEHYRASRDKSPVKAVRAASASDCLRLNDLGVTASDRRPTTQVTAPASRYSGAWWFHYAERMKPYAPESIRQLVRRRLSDDTTIPVVRFRLPGEMAKVRSELRIKRRYLSTTLLVSQGRDPHIELELEKPLDPTSVELFRFNLWCSTPSTAYAQLFWQSEGRRHFDELHSFMVPLNGLSASWQEYSVRLRGVPRASAWFGGGPVTRLRFDPINLPGLIGLGELSFCAYPPEDSL